MVIDALQRCVRGGDARALARLYARGAFLEAHLPHETVTRRGPASITDLLASWWAPPGELVEWAATEYPSGLDITFERHPVDGGRPWTSRQWHEVYLSGDRIVRHVIWSDRPRFGEVYGPLPEAIAEIVGEVERKPSAHAGLSGSSLEVLLRGDGVRYVLKHVRPTRDVMLRETHDVGREALISMSGVLRDVGSIDDAVVAVAPEQDGWAILMRDVSPYLVSGPGRSDAEALMTGTERRRILGAVVGLHDGLRGRDVESACSVVDRLRLLGPSAMAAGSGGLDALPRWVSRSWNSFFEVVPADIGAAIAAIHANPAALARELERESTTLIHGDLWGPNIGVADDRVILLDWAQACVAPPEMEYAFWAIWNPEFTGLSSAELLDEAKVVVGSRVDERAMSLAVLGELAANAGARGWAWYATDGIDAENREAERAELDWWIAEARGVLDRVWAPGREAANRSGGEPVL